MGLDQSLFLLGKGVFIKISIFTVLSYLFFYLGNVGTKGGLFQRLCFLVQVDLVFLDKNIERLVQVVGYNGINFGCRILENVKYGSLGKEYRTYQFLVGITESSGINVSKIFGGSNKERTHLWSSFKNGGSGTTRSLSPLTTESGANDWGSGGGVAEALSEVSGLLRRFLPDLDSDRTGGLVTADMAKKGGNENGESDYENAVTADKQAWECWSVVR